MNNLDRAFIAQKKKTQQVEKELYGSLGIPINGRKTIEVPNRQSYVYVRLRDNQNEVVQAFNNKVAASYDLPVIMVREGNRYAVQSVNTQRYENNWNNSSPYLPKHGTSHSFPYGGGGDVTWIFERQIMPALVYPNTETGTNVKMYGYPFLANDNVWRLVGNTGTQDVIGYRPITGAMSLMVLVYLDANTGNPGLLVNSGTYFPQNITGNNVYQYLPSPVSHDQIPLAGVRLSTGTSVIAWGDIYGVRQWVHSFPTGTSGVGSGTSVNVQDEGVPQGVADTFNFVGDNVSVSISGTVARVFITGASGAGSSLDHFWTSGTHGINPIQAINPTTPRAIGNYSVAIGQANIVSGTASFALGSDNFVRGNSSHVGGSSNVVLGNTSHAYGSSNVVSGTNSSVVASASSHVIGNLSAIVGGNGNRLTGNNNVLLGGSGLNKSGSETAFVPKLNIDTLQSGTPTSWLGIDSNQNVISGSLGIYDEGVPKGGVLNLNFVGNDVDVSISGTTARVYISGTHPNGKYNPTLVSGTNTQTVIGTDWLYSVDGNIVTVGGLVQVDTGAIGAFTFFASLPIPSNFTSTSDATGNGTNPVSGPSIISIREDQTNDRFQFDGYAQVATNLFYRFMAMYIIK